MRGDGETLVLGSSRSLDCGGLIHNTSCPAPPCPCQQMALWWVKFFFPVGNWEAVPPHCILPGCTESAMPLLLSPNLRYICGSCEKRKKGRRRCKLESEETIWGEQRERRRDTRELSLGSSCWVIINPDVSEILGVSVPPLYTCQTLDHPQPPL